ncbi:MAG: ABC transporter ATP-binding protein [Anaerolineae bacterium]
MAMIRFTDVTFRYPDSRGPVLQGASVNISGGEFALVVGRSGVGKSTFLRCINGLVPHFTGGVFAGKVQVSELDPVAVGPEVMSRHVGFVFQDPEAQFVMDTVEDEVAFALENAAMAPSEMKPRVGAALELLALTDLRRRPLTTLSGGEKQRVAIAAALALRPEILVLDEPTSQLDPESAESVLRALATLKAELGLTIVLAEHRLERVLAFTDKVVYLTREGAVVAGPPAEVLQQTSLAPPVTVLGKALGWSPLPVTLEEARRFVLGTSRPAALDDAGAQAPQSQTLAPPAPETRSRPSASRAEPPPVLRAASLSVGYNGKQVLHDVDLALWQGEVTVLMGRNGAGKTTLLKSLVGLVRPKAGRVWLRERDTVDLAVAEICRKVAYLPQDPNVLLFAETVRDELLITLRNHDIPPSEAPVAPDALLAKLGLEAEAAAYPRDLSVGERQRVALAAITITHPDAVLLDEPTRGLDYDAKAQLIELIRTWQDEGLAVLVVTHDVELAAAAATRLVLLDEGRVQRDGAPYEVLSQSALFAPQIEQLFPGFGWLTVSDALAALESREPTTS